MAFFKSYSRPFWKSLIFLALSQIIGLGVGLLLIETAMVGIRGYIYKKYDVLSEFEEFSDVEVETVEANLFITTVGDSHTWGVGADLEYNYPRQLARIIYKKHSNIRPNMKIVARPGRNSAEALTALKESLEIGPYKLHQNDIGQKLDIVVICVGKNNNHNLRGIDYLNKYIADVPERARLANILETSGAYQLKKITRSRIRQLVNGDVIDKNTYFCVLCDENDPFLKEWVRHDFQEMIDIAGKLGAKVVLMTYWEEVPFVDKIMESLAKSNDDVIFVSQHGFNLPLFCLEEPYLAPDTHPNEKGYARIAAHLYQSLDNKGWLTPRPDSDWEKISGVE
jgi:lysophospholipase L1-like esterase